jgi:CGNR zinc finger
MTRMNSTLASERFDTSIAPSELFLTQELMNTIAHLRRAPYGNDLLDTVDTATPWLMQVTESWSEDHGIATPKISITPSFLGKLRALREELRRIRSGEEANTLMLAAEVSVRTDENGTTAIPQGENLAWIKSALAVEGLDADRRGDLRRLKLCRNSHCGVTFFDRSKNNSRVWHDVSKCGNAANVRSFRVRARTSSPNP